MNNATKLFTSFTPLNQEKSTMIILNRTLLLLALAFICVSNGPAQAALVYHDITTSNTVHDDGSDTPLFTGGTDSGDSRWELRDGNSNFFNDDAAQAFNTGEMTIVMTITGLTENATYTDVRIYARGDQSRGGSYSYDGSSFTDFLTASGTGTDATNGGIGNDAAANGQRYYIDVADFTANGSGEFSIWFQPHTDGSTRSDIDGIAFDSLGVVVPAPAAMPAGLALLGLAAARRKRGC